MSELRKEVEQALDESEIYDTYGARWGKERIDALRAALAQGRSDVQPERKPLTEEEIAALSEQHIFASRLTKFVRAIEKAHGIGGQP